MSLWRKLQSCHSSDLHLPSEGPWPAVHACRAPPFHLLSSHLWPRQSFLCSLLTFPKLPGAQRGLPGGGVRNWVGVGTGAEQVGWGRSPSVSVLTLGCGASFILRSPVPTGAQVPGRSWLGHLPPGPTTLFTPSLAFPTTAPCIYTSALQDTVGSQSKGPPVYPQAQHGLEHHGRPINN